MPTDAWGQRGRPRSIRELTSRWRKEVADEAFAALVTYGPQPVRDISADLEVDAGALRRVMELDENQRFELFQRWAYVSDCKVWSWCVRIALPADPPPRKKCRREST